MVVLRGRTAAAAVWTVPFVVFATIVGLALVFNDDVSAQRSVDGIGFGVIELLGLLFCVRAATHPALSRQARRPWRYVAVAFAMLILAGIGFTASVGNSPTVNPQLLLALTGRLLFVIVLLRALTLFEAQKLTRGGAWKVSLDVATIVGSGLMVTWYFLVGPTIASTDAHTLIWASAVGYTIGDLLLVFGVAVVLLRGTATSARGPLGLLLVSCVGFLVLDVYITHAAVHNQQLLLPGSGWLTVAIVTPVFLMVVAASEQVRLAAQRRMRPARRLLRRPVWLPYAAVVVGFGPLVVAAGRAAAYPWWGLVAGVVLTTTAVAARQVISLRENRALVVTDSLTGLASRVRLLDTLRRATDQNPHLVAVLHIDLDDFKRINDVYGHDAGDDYLMAFATVLRANIRATDTAARLGGDEFAVVLEGVRNPGQAVEVAERILAQAAEPTLIGEHQLRMRASVGIAVATGSTVRAEEILHWADLAMYVAKRRQSHGWQLYAEGSMDDGHDTTRRLLAAAVPADQLRLAYQPIVSLPTGDLVAVEALVRWEHPTRGLVAPLEFIPLAEESGAIHEIGLWVVDEASRRLTAWRTRLAGGRSLQLMVNLSPRQLSSGVLAQEILGILDTNDFAPTDLVAEVTESGVVEDGTAVGQLEALRARGVRVALDDFGTGYSSLRYLTRLPVDVLKLDRCFVGELNGRPEGSAVAEAVVRLAQILHLDTVAEGIENREQATELTLHGYRNGQGFHYSPPLSAAEMEGLIDASGDTWPRLSGRDGQPGPVPHPAGAPVPPTPPSLTPPP